MSALNASVGNMFKGRGTKPIEYLKEPFDLFGEQHKCLTDEMSDEEKMQKLFEMLGGMQERFENSKQMNGGA